jgi:hypothetical protein
MMVWAGLATVWAVGVPFIFGFWLRFSENSGA